MRQKPLILNIPGHARELREMFRAGMAAGLIPNYPYDLSFFSELLVAAAQELTVSRVARAHGRRAGGHVYRVVSNFLRMHHARQINGSIDRVDFNHGGFVDRRRLGEIAEAFVRNPNSNWRAQLLEVVPEEYCNDEWLEALTYAPGTGLTHDRTHRTIAVDASNICTFFDSLDTTLQYLDIINRYINQDGYVFWQVEVRGALALIVRN